MVRFFLFLILVFPSFVSAQNSGVSIFFGGEYQSLLGLDAFKSQWILQQFAPISESLIGGNAGIAFNNKRMVYKLSLSLLETDTDRNIGNPSKLSSWSIMANLERKFFNKKPFYALKPSLGYGVRFTSLTGIREPSGQFVNLNIPYLPPSLYMTCKEFIGEIGVSNQFCLVPKFGLGIDFTLGYRASLKISDWKYNDITSVRTENSSYLGGWYGKVSFFVNLTDFISATNFLATKTFNVIQ